MIRLKVPLSLLSSCILCSCQAKTSFAEKAVTSYYAASIIDHKDPILLPIEPYTKNKEAGWQFLDRATIRLAQGDASGSINDYLMAMDASDFYRNSLLQEQVAQWLVDDAQAAYIPPFHEALLARFMAACACFQSDDPKNGIAFLRQALELESLQHELVSLSTPDFHPLIHYLLAVAMEFGGDMSQAKLLYQRLGMSEGRGEKDKAQVVFVIYDRVIPKKESEVAPTSIVSMQLLELLLKAYHIQPALSSLSGIAIPIFPEHTLSFPPPILSIDGEKTASVLSYDVFSAAKAELQQQIPFIAARAAARQLIRRASIGYAYEKDQPLGRVVDIGMLFANLMTKADTRMWNALPQEIFLFRKDLEPGDHTIALSHGKEHTIRVGAGDLVVVQIFRPHGHETRFLIPKSKVTT